MAIAQMNWGTLLYPLADHRMAEFQAPLAHVYELAEAHEGFIWRVSDADAAKQLSDLEFDEKTSATVSVWQSVEALRDYTFNSLHGDYLERAGEWFEEVAGPQLVIWDVDASDRPSFGEAFHRLAMLKRDGPTPNAYGWKP